MLLSELMRKPGNSVTVMVVISFIVNTHFGFIYLHVVSKYTYVNQNFNPKTNLNGGT